MQRLPFLVASIAVMAGIALAGDASAATNDAFLKVSGIASTACTSYDGFGGCVPGTSTTSTFSGITGSCSGICPSTTGTVNIDFKFVKFPPNPCQTNKVVGTLTLAYPNDPEFAQQSILVDLTGHLRDDHAVVLSGTYPPNPWYPPGPIKVLLSLTFSPNPCTPDTGTFTGSITLG